MFSAVSSYITILAQRSGGAIQTLEFLPLETRILNAVVAYTKYIFSLFYPVKLSVWYPYDENFAVWQIAGSIDSFARNNGTLHLADQTAQISFDGLALVSRNARSGHRLVQVGTQPMADRYTYIPFFGLFIMLVWGLNEIFVYFKIDKKIILSFSVLVIIFLSILSFGQVSKWRNDETLYKHSLSVTNGNYLILQNYCHFLMLKDRLDEAEKLCREAIETKPTYAESYNTLGVIQFKRKEYAAAAENFRKTLELKPRDGLIYFNLANALALNEQPEEAEAQLQRAIVFTPPNENPPVWIDALMNLAFAYGEKDKISNAAENFERILQIAPERADVRANYALTLYKLKRYDEAQTQIEYSIKQNPYQAKSFNNYGLILLEKQENQKAVEQFEKALQLQPDFSEASENLKKAKGEK